MILAVNAGNALISAGLYSKEGQRAKAVFSGEGAATSYEHSYKLRSFIEACGCEPRQVEGAIIAPVNPVSAMAMSEAVRMTFGVTPLQVGAGIRTGLDILLKDPATMGADMVAAAVAALSKYTPPVIIVTVGAIALVISAINGRGQFMGASIAPSPRLALSALCERAAYLPATAIEAPARLIGTDTREAINSGVVYGAAAMIRGMTEMMLDKITDKPHNDHKAKIIITGSVAPAILPYLGMEAELDENLILDGLNFLYHRNRRNQAK